MSRRVLRTVGSQVLKVRMAATVTARPVDFELGQIALRGETPVNGTDMQQCAVDFARVTILFALDRPLYRSHRSGAQLCFGFRTW